MQSSFDRRRSFLITLAVFGTLVLCTVQIVLALSYVSNILPLGGDARAYFAASRALMAGESPIGPNMARFLPEASGEIPVYLYPPLLALLFTPLAIIPYSLGMNIWLCIVALTTLLLIPALRQLVGWRVAVLGVLLFLPAWQSFWLGQINAIIALSFAMALSAPLTGAERRTGVMLAIGAMLKMTPAIGILILAIKRQWRGVAIAAGVVAACVLFSLPFASFTIWYEGMLHALQSTWTTPLLRSWTAILRGLGGGVGSIAAPLVAGAMLLMTLARSISVSVRMALAAACILPLLISGVIWQYSALMGLPALAVLWRYNERGRILAFSAWAAISLAGMIWQPIMLTMCWAACCWPALLGPEDASPALE